MTPEHRKKLQEIMMGNERWKANIGKPFSDERKAAISDGLKNYWLHRRMNDSNRKMKE